MWFTRFINTIFQCSHHAEPDLGFITIVYRSNREAVVVHDTLSVANRAIQESVPDTEHPVFEDGISSWDGSEYDSDLGYDMSSSSEVDWEEGCPSHIDDCLSEDFEAASWVHPCSGLPMLDDVIDVAGNPWGICNDINVIESDSADMSSSMFDDSI